MARVKTPTFLGTAIGIVLAAFGLLGLFGPGLFEPASVLIGPGGLLLTIVGWGGIGIALHMGVKLDKDPWRLDTVLEAIVDALRGERERCLFGLLGHVGQGVAGVVLLWMA